MKANHNHNHNATPTATVNANANADASETLAKLSDEGEPPAQWALHTLDALGPVMSEPYPADEPAHIAGTAGTEDLLNQQPSSTATTPGSVGQLVPGAFPGGGNVPPVHQHDAHGVNDVGHTALETVREYAVKTGETVGGYLPASVAAYLPASTTNSQINNNSTSPPSQELSQDSHPSLSGGVGTLPGPPGEIAAAVRPDERKGDKSPDATPDVDCTSKSKTNTDTSPAMNISTSTTTSSTNDIDPTVKENSLASHPESETMPDTDTGFAKLPEGRGQEVLPSHDDDNSNNARTGKNTESSLRPGLEDQDATGASTDASTRSLAGSRFSRGGWDTTNNTPGTSMFGGHGAASVKQAQGGDGDGRTPTLKEEDSDVSSQAQPLTESKPQAQAQPLTESKPQAQAQPRPQSGQHFDKPVTDAREHPLAAEEARKFGSEQGKPGAAAKYSTDSAVATPGHTMPVKDVEGTSGVSAAAAGGAGTAAGTDAADHAAPPASAEAANSANATTTPAATAAKQAVKGENGTKHESVKKPGFLDRLRGEMKVLTGKLEHKEEKVEEGRRMMGKSTAGTAGGSGSKIGN
ncbi:hypothetical protein BDZ97DRAFT_1847597 [Flammula alnicola]|nr:hypothetical protein BDZ97DRAFT_1847597 [Flammula alnicola]